MSKQKLVPVTKKYKQMIEDKILLFQEKEDRKKEKSEINIIIKNNWKSPFMQQKQ